MRRTTLALLAILGCLATLTAIRLVSHRGEISVVSASGEAWNIPVSDARQVPIRFRGKSRLTSRLAAADAGPRALATADLDVDGYPDAVSGYATSGGYAISFQKGNRDAHNPTGAAFETFRSGGFIPPFLSEATVTDSPISPDFLGTGLVEGIDDINVVAASRDGGIAVFRVQNGQLELMEELHISGEITALAVNQTEQRSRFAQVFLGVRDAAGARTVVYAGAESGLQEVGSWALSGDAASFAFGPLDGRGGNGVAVAAGGKLHVLTGYEIGDAMDAPGGQHSLNPEPTSFDVASATTGYYLFDRDPRFQIAALSQDGTLHILSRKGRDSRMYTPEEVEMNYAEDVYEPAMRFEPSNSRRKTTWEEVETVPGFTEVDSRSVPVLFTAKVSGTSWHDVMAVAPRSGTISMLAHTLQKAEFVKRRNAMSTPVATVAEHLNMRPGHGILTLNSDGSGLTAMAAAGGGPRAAGITYTVNTTADASPSTAGRNNCINGSGTCTLRDAISAANYPNDNVTIVIPAGTYTLTVPNPNGQLQELQNAGGDLNPNSNITFVGAGSGSTIIQGGTTATNGIDRVFGMSSTFPVSAANPGPHYGVGANLSFSGMTIRYGRNPSLFTNSGNGGGAQLELGYLGTITLTDMIFDSNTALDGNGGGIQINSSGSQANHTPTFTVSNSSFTNNTVNWKTSSGGVQGGGINQGLYVSATMTNVTISGNTVNCSCAGVTKTASGGGYEIQSQSGPSSGPYTNSLLHKVTIRNNQVISNAVVTSTSFPRSGGIDLQGSFNIDQGSVISGNSVAGTSGQGGAMFDNTNQSATSILHTTITGNSASTVGGYYVSRTNNGVLGKVINYSYIAGNIATVSPSGSQLWLQGQGNTQYVDATNNWWDCTGDPTSSACGNLVAQAGGGTSDGTKITLMSGATLKSQITFGPYLLAKATFNPTYLLNASQTSILTIGFKKSDNTLLNVPADVDQLLGLPVSYTPSFGSLTNKQTTIQTNGTATATFNAPSLGVSTIAVVVGTNGTVNQTIRVGPNFLITVPSTAIPGVPFNVTVTAASPGDPSTVDTAYSGTVHFTSGDSAAVLPANSTLINGTKTFSVTLNTAGPQSITVADSVGTSIKATSSTITVGAGPATHFKVTAPGSATAGTSFTYTVTAADASEATATGYTGTVHFTSTDGSAVLPANATLTNGVGSFSATLKTAGSKTITATDTVTGSINGTSGSIAVGAAAATKLTVSAPSSATAGTSFNATVTAQDAFGNTVTGYAGTVHFTSTDPGSPTLPSDSTLTSGAGTFAVTLKTASSRTITATDTGSSSIAGTSGTITVSPGVLSKFKVTVPSSATAGVAFSFTVTAQDAYDNTLTGYAGTVSFTTSAGSFSLPGSSGLTNGVGSFSATLNSSGSQTITATDGAVSTASGTITVNAAAASHFSVSASSPQTAGTSFSVTVTALDSSNNVATAYAGTVHITSTDGSAVLPADNSLSSGTRTFTVTLKTAGTQTITASEVGNSSVNGNSGNINVVASTASSLTVSAPANATAGTSFSFSVTALDAYGNTATGFSGTVTFSSSDSQKTLPADTTLSAGVGTFSATLKTAGTQTISASQVGNSSVNGTSGNITVAAGSAARLAVNAPSSSVAGSSFNVTVTAQDSYGNTATGYTGTVTFSSTDTQAVFSPASGTLNSGTRTFTGTILKTSGNQTISVVDNLPIPLSGSSGVIAVSPAAASQYRIVSPTVATAGTSFPFTVTAYDQFNNIATGYAGTVHFASTDPQAVVPANTTLTNGAGSFNATFKTASDQPITANDTVAAITQTNTLTVNPGPAVQFSVVAPPTAIPGASFGVVVTAFDNFGNIATTYTGTAALTSTAASYVPPSNFTLANGTATVQVTINSSGNQTVTVTDTVNNSVTGTSGPISSSVRVVFTSNPAGGALSVDGTVYQGEAVLSLAPGSVHTIAAVPTITPDRRSAFVRWSDGGGASHTITVPAANATYTVSYKTQFYVTTSAEIAVGGTVTPPSGYYDEGDLLTLAGVANAGYEFKNWITNGEVSLLSPTTASIYVTGPLTIRGIFDPVATLEVSPTSLNEQYYQGTSPSVLSRTFSIGSNVPSNVVASSSVPWITVGVGGGSATATLDVSKLPVGVNTGTIFFSSAARTIPVSVTVTVFPKPTLLASPGSIAFTAQAGSTAIQTQRFSIGAQPRNTNVTASASVAWLTAAMDRSETPSFGTVSADPSGMAAGVYSGNIIVSASDALNSPLMIPVTLTITGAPVAAGTLSNGASFGAGGLSPNEIVTLFAANLTCPGTLGVSVNGVPVPALGATSTQVSFTVPQNAGTSGTALIQVTCDGRPIATASGSLVPLAPAIFARGQNGQGQAAALNQDNSSNGASNPARRGRYLSLYVTGFGELSAPGSDGLRRITGTITVLVGGIPATISYAGEAPGFTLGLQQINILIPDNAPVGSAVPVSVTINGVPAQTGVIIAVQ